MLSSRSLHRWVAALSVAILVTAPLAARAQDPAGAPKRADDPVAAEARRHYEEGTKAFNLGEFPRAIAEFKAAYNAKSDPSFLYNIAQSYRLQGDAGQAIFFYKSFLRNMPAAPNRKDVEGRIHSLEKQADEQRKEAAPGAVPPAATAPPPAVPAVQAAPATAPASPTVPPSPAPSPQTPVPATGDTGAKPADNAPLSTVPPALDLQNPPPAPATADLSTPPADEPAPGKPLYKKWWFWTGIGAALLIGVGVAAAARNKPPSTTLGLFDPTFVKPQ